MKKGIGVLFAVGAVSLLAAQPALGGKGGKGKEPVVEIDTTTSVDYFTTSPTTALYTGDLDCTPVQRGKSQKVRKKRQALAKGCEINRTVQIFHNGFLIATTEVPFHTGWLVYGPKPPSGDFITVVVTESSANPRAHCKSATVVKQIFG